MAGAEGFEPSTKVLETHVLPLHHAPSLSRTRHIIYGNARFVNTFLPKRNIFCEKWNQGSSRLRLGR